MKLLFKIFLVFFTLSIVALGAILLARAGKLDRYITNLTQIYLTHSNSKAKVKELHIKGNTLLVDSIEISFPDGTKSALEGVKSILSIKGTWTEPLIEIDTKIQNAILKSQSGEDIFRSIISSNYLWDLFKVKNKMEFTLNNISSETLLDIDGIALSSGSINCKASHVAFLKSNFGCKFSFGETSHLFIDGSVKSNQLILHGSASNMPIMLYKVAEKIAPNNPAIEFLHEYIQAGHIISGEFNLNLDNKFFKTKKLLPHNIDGNFKVSSLDLQYAYDYPILKKIETDVIISGSEFKFLLKQGYTGNTLLSDGVIALDWQGVEKSNVIVNATANGPAVDLIDFIPQESYEHNKQIGIDLKTLKGNASSKVYIKIPTSSTLKNSYLITSEISNVELKAFDNKLHWSSNKISGIFDGDKVALSGESKINNFKSNMSYQYNLEGGKESQDFSSLLQITAQIKGGENAHFDFLRLASGEAELYFEYKSKGESNIITASSDLKRLELYIDKIGIHKLAGKSANFSVNYALNDLLFGVMDFKLTGEDNLNVSGEVLLEEGKSKVTLSNIKHYNTDAKGIIHSSKDSFKAEIKGSNLDLSNSDMMQFLTKEHENINTSLKVDLSTIKLKDNILIKDVKLNIECDKIRCYKGSMESTIGTRDISMNLNSIDAETEQWVIKSTNAGALLRGLGMYESMKSGDMLITINTKRKEIKPGEVVPIIDGQFSINKFVITNKSFLTNLVSLVSLPGFMNLITNSNDIAFASMTGKFNYINNSIQVKGAKASGPFFDLTMDGDINTAKRALNLKGRVTPSIYGINSLITNIPIVGKILSGGHRKGLVSAPYKLKQSY